MLGCMRRAFDLLAQHRGLRLTMETVPAEDPATYEMIRHADTLGTFQIESRAQMSMLPRLKPRTFYDLVIQVAIVRPGPIQGDMVHPYLRRREGKEPIDYPTPELRAVLEKTLGVPLFQEQAMRVAIVCAGFSPGEADQLRRAMATFKAAGTISAFREKLIAGMVARGYQRAFAERTFSQIEGFGSYGFPESHAASFALIAYASSWMKCHHPDVFCCALLNAQQMGFYAPAQIVRDARQHGVEVRPVCVNASRWDCTLELTSGEPAGEKFLAVRLGLCMVKGLANAHAAALIGARGQQPYRSVADVWQRAGVPVAALERIAEADGFHTLEHVHRDRSGRAGRTPLPLAGEVGERREKGEGAAPGTNPHPRRKGSATSPASGRGVRSASQTEGLDRRQALWAIRGLADSRLPLFAAADEAAEPGVALPPMPQGGEVVEDYRSVGLSLRRHPVSFLRAELARERILPCAALAELRDGARATVAGVILVRQRPGSASGVLFITIEDETGHANLILWPSVFERQRRLVMSASMLGCRGKVQKEGEVIHVIADHLTDFSPLLASVGARGEEFPLARGRGDAVTHPNGDDPRERGIKVATRDFR
jgi:error-prone DNA polymerase